MYNTKNDEPLVSVIIPTYKRADRLSNTINSVCTFLTVQVHIPESFYNDDIFVNPYIEILVISSVYALSLTFFTILLDRQLRMIVISKINRKKTSK